MNKKKVFLSAMLIALLLAVSVGGTIAWLTDNSGPVTNTFTPAQVDTEIEEVFAGNAKTSIKVRNVSDVKNIPAYIRVALVGNWCDADGNIVEPWTPSFTLGDGWDDGNDGYYYHKEPVAVGDTTSELLGSAISGTDANKSGLRLIVTVIQQGIQSEPTSVVAENWGVTVSGTTISK